MLVDDKLRDEVEGMFEKAHIVLTNKEKRKMEYTDFGMGNVYEEGMEIVIYINTDRYCAKDLVLLPHQTCLEHRHPTRPDGTPGKMETFRCRYGKVFLYVEGEATEAIQGKVPEKNKQWYTVMHEIVLNPGEQYTIQPNTRHWFQAGAEGAIVSEFSSPSDDATDIYTNPYMKRTPADR
ncbi:D-lyxose ketol-isomerase [Propionispora sp. 2/2-37]|uniref:D-lyxose/D-mannose family sugar isomerase n=1 Tax=Propionispora sp. 2/2-37 TaxID=1677858 RepID=UPI0006BB640B|nr:D-lyxose/D-mannose family sugar isomerase [Propionispora sp. 2/2-37]CUH96694.1 D-lyxose ketol-isomerase [Propionispora sp. 2/2-37]